MRLKKHLKGLLAAPLAALLLTCTAPLYAATKIMPLGDSITGSPGCWRAYLWEKLLLSNYNNIDMVGTLPAQGCAVAYDGDNEGHGGILAINMANQSQLPAWLSATTPDIVLMHLGTNDVWSSKPTSEILAAFTTLVQQMRTSKATIKIVVAKIIPMDSARSCSTCTDGVIALNNALPAWAAGLSTSASPITIADIWTGFSAISDTYDGVHPTDAGHKKIADSWYPAVVTALGGTTSSSAASSSISSSSSKSSAVSSTASCADSCNWYGQSIFPLCVTATSGFNFENGTTCVARSTCLIQAPGYGGIIPGTCGQSSSSVNSSSSIKSSSSAPITSTSSSSKSSSPSSSSTQATSSSVASSSSSLNHAPVAVITGGTRFTPCCSVNLSAADSTDADGDTLTYTWTVVDCGSYTNNTCNRSSASSSSAGYTVSGVTLTYSTPADDASKVTLTVSDGRGGISTATRSFSYIVETLSSSSRTSSSVPSSSSSAPSSSSSSSAVSGAQCTYVVSNEWNTGFTALIRITNKGTTAINGWNVNWSYSDGTKLTNSWNATVTGTNPYSATNLNWNNLIQPGQSVEIGIQGNKGTSSAAQIPIINGAICN